MHTLYAVQATCAATVKNVCIMIPCQLKLYSNGADVQLFIRPAEAGLMPKDIYGGPRGAIAQLAQLADWFEHQREFCFYSSSVLIIYEGAATSADAAAVSIRLVTIVLLRSLLIHPLPLSIPAARGLCRCGAGLFLHVHVSGLKLEALHIWAQAATQFHSVAEKHTHPRCALQVDFAHTFPSGGQLDENFTAGARALLQALKAVVSMDAHDCLM